MDCKVDTGKTSEYYMLIDKVWYAVCDFERGMLCIDCIETRLGRKLTKKDFTECFLNKLTFGAKSAKLVNRLGRIA